MMLKRLGLVFAIGLVLTTARTPLRGDPVVEFVNGSSGGTASVTACRLVGDFDHDRDVDANDLQLVVELWRRQQGDPGFDHRFDLHPNGVIDVIDLMLAAANWGSTGQSAFGVNMFGSDISESAIVNLAQQAEICWVMHGLSWSRVEPQVPSQGARASGNASSTDPWRMYDVRYQSLYDAGMNLFVVIGSNPSWAASTSCG